MVWGINLFLINRIGFRLLIFNILLVFLPIAFIFYLDTYENGELRAQERSMVQQGRLMASALGDRDLKLESERILKTLNKRSESRIRVIDLQGNIVGDSSRPVNSDSEINLESSTRYSAKNGDKPLDSTLLYRSIRWFLDLARYVINGPSRGYQEEDRTPILQWVEVQKAMEGKYGSATRISRGGQRSVTLYSAIPIYNGKNIAGVVIVSQSTYRILQNLYSIRLDLLRIFLITLTIALGISYIMTRTISYPLKKLRNQAYGAISSTGKVTNKFIPSKRRDEIGDLNQSLYELTSKLKNHLEKSQEFASDLSHEIRNPLASIKTAAEIIESNPDDSIEFIEKINREVYRLERLITGVRELSKIDNSSFLEDVKPVNTLEIIKMVIASLNFREDNQINFIVKGDEEPLLISPTLFTQVIENILSNAYSFSNDGDNIVIELTRNDEELTVQISDNGPGIPKENMERVFNRFFSYRDGDSTKNSGIGLSIVKSIMDLYKGSVELKNLEGAGLQVTLKFRISNTLQYHL